MGPVQLSIATALTFSVIHLLNNHFSKTLPKDLTETTGLIRPSKALSIFCVIVTGAMFTGGLWLFLSDEEILVGLICGGMRLFGFVVMLPSLTNLHNVKWDDTGVYGPAGSSFPRFPTQQIKINWVDIVKTDEAWSNYRYVEDLNGQRIFWGYWYRGEMELRKLIAQKMNPKF